MASSLLLSLALALAGCSDDTQPSKADQLVSKDLGPVHTDGKSSACTTSAECVSASMEAKVCDTATGRCVQCLSSADCAANPYTWGPTCNTTADPKVCSCSAEIDCANNPYGPRCDTTNGWCICSTDPDCGSSLLGKKCDPSWGCGCETTDDCAAPRTCDPVLRVCM